MKLDKRDLFLRFVLGGAAVAACYIILRVLPWKSFAGIFAAFPAVMVAAVIMAGVSQGSKHAADVALGATAGMLGCTVCVVVAMLLFGRISSWSLVLILSLVAWFVGAALSLKIIRGLLDKQKA